MGSFHAESIAQNEHDRANRAKRVVSGISLPQYDYASLAQTSTVDTWTFKTGGASGTTVATLTITYTDSTKETISTVVKT